MKKKLFYTVCFVVIGVCLFLLLNCFPNMLFPETDKIIWNKFRLIAFSAFIAGFIGAVIFIANEKALIFPYFAKLNKYRPLLYQLVRRDFKAKYRRSVLGVFWTLLNPLLTMIVMTIVFSTLFRFQIANFPVYLFSGTLIFTFFNESTSMAMVSIVSASAMLKKISLPKYIFPATRVVSSLVNLALTLVALFVVILATRAPFHWTLALIPVPICYLFVFCMGVGLILASLNVFFRDIVYLYGVFITALTYLTPIFYPIEIVPARFQAIWSLNPIYHYIRFFRDLVLYGVVPTLWENIICASFSVAALLLGLYIFYKKQDRFILYI